MIALGECKDLAQILPDYVEGRLDPEEASHIQGHLVTCRACREAAKRFKEVQDFLKGVVGPGAAGREFALETGKRLAGIEPSCAAPLEEPIAPMPAPWFERLAGMAGGLPWWIVSALLHGFLILLVGLVTMAVHRPDLESAMITVTSLDRKPESREEVKKPEARDILNALHDTPPTDPNALNASNIVVPPDILAKAELGDHFETINLDRPDTQSAFGNPDARMFHSASGNDEPEGGGGMGGASLAEELIGVGGSNSPGTGGGWGGGNGTGVGIGNGSGKGSFGSRTGGGRRLMVMRHGGSKATESAVEKALEWLARHQEADGSWCCRKTDGDTPWDPGVTGLATLAFLGAGHSEKVGKYKEHVSRAVKWMILLQKPDGSIGMEDRWAESYYGKGYHHAICGLALCEAAAMGRAPETRAAAQKAIDYSTDVHQCGEGSDRLAWRYYPKKECDLSVSGWYVMQLKSAKVAGLRVDPACFDGAIKFLDRVMQDPNEVKVEDPAYDNGKHRYGYMHNRLGNDGIGVNTTAIGILCRLFTGTKPDEVRGAAHWLLRTHPAKWDAQLGSGGGNSFGWPMYYSYYTTLTLFQVGGEEWKKWNESLKTMLLPNQRRDGDADGSWDPLAMWEKRAGRAYSTALGAMSLEVYYRYLPMYR